MNCLRGYAESQIMHILNLVHKLIINPTIWYGSAKNV